MRCLKILVVALMSSSAGWSSLSFSQTETPRKRVDLLIGVDPGGLYDFQARVVARHISNYLPGAPTIVPQNMPGAGGLKMAAYLADIAPKDGSAIGTIPSSFPFMQAIGLPDIKFDVGKF